MPDMLMAMNTVRLAFVARAAMGNFLYHFAMTMNAVTLQDRSVLAMNANRFVEVLQGKPFGVPEAIFRLGEILADKIVGQMTVHATGCIMMTGLLPAVVLLSHDMAVHAGFGIATEIAEPFPVIHGICPRTHANADQGPDQDTDDTSTYQPLQVFHSTSIREDDYLYQTGTSSSTENDKNLRSLST